MESFARPEAEPSNLIAPCPNFHRRKHLGTDRQYELFKDAEMREIRKLCCLILPLTGRSAGESNGSVGNLTGAIEWEMRMLPWSHPWSRRRP